MLNTFLDGIKEINSMPNILYACVAVLIAMVIGFIIYFTYRVTSGEFEFESGFGLVLIIVPVVVALLLSVIGTNIARAFSLAGALSIIRYRSAIVRPKDLAFIFFGMGAGFIVGVGLYLPAAIFVFLTCLVIILYTVAHAPKAVKVKKTLKVAIPENIDYDGLLNGVLEKYTSSFALTGIRIISGGTVTELSYSIKIKDMKNNKLFLDEIRTLNANFKIQLTEFVPPSVG